jgi:very-short-patch-repair endonuclease
VVTLTQARHAGLSQAAVARRVRGGSWRRCAKGVYFVDDRPFTDAARIRAAVWAYGPTATASGLAAAWWHGLSTVAPRLVEVTLPRSSHGRSRTGTRVRRRDLSDVDVTERRALRVTALELTVVEAATRRRGDGPRIMDTALQRQVELGALWRAHLQAAADGARSEAERLLVRLLREADLTGWRTNHLVAGYRVDVAFTGPKVAIEVDGFAFHTDSDVFQRDRMRQNAISLCGWQVLRFTWLDLTQYPDRVTATIRSAILAR